jgi:ribosomal RNA assembly protein
MSESITRCRIPVERVGVLIGAEGNAKKIIEKKYRLYIEVDSKTGDIQVFSKIKTVNPAMIFRVKDIILAVGRGFSPEKAFRLFNEDVNFGIIDLREIFGRSLSDIQRIKGRIIGKNGKTRIIIEELTGASISVYGHTISIIGELSQFDVAREAIAMFIEGRMHKNVYGFLHRKRADLKKEELELWKTPPSEHIKE